MKFADGTPIYKPVPSDLLSPESGSRRGPTEKMAVVTVPETAVHEDHGIVAWQRKVRSARKFF